MAKTKTMSTQDLERELAAVRKTREALDELVPAFVVLNDGKLHEYWNLDVLHAGSLQGQRDLLELVEITRADQVAWCWYTALFTEQWEWPEVEFQYTGWLGPKAVRRLRDFGREFKAAYPQLGQRIEKYEQEVQETAEEIPLEDGFDREVREALREFMAREGRGASHA